MKVYTKTGDNGTTGLVGGQRVEKNSLRIHAIGEIDELNAIVGVCRVSASVNSIDSDLARIQNLLFDVGAELATPDGSKFNNSRVDQSDIEWLERSMDENTERLEPLRNFVLPTGCPLAANLHLARSVCRRAERVMTSLHQKEPVRSELFVFINRLSDWFFVIARIANSLSNVEDVKWSPRG
ncbi:MAG: cob(I)yrinic acid a,c-diamide adenosyltransferase [Fimbriimonadaceae bacterium]|nr:cob(I)yrinic acid a,c-diamide adenosyltransferase [Fimbriimonadaceae bacterium]